MNGRTDIRLLLLALALVSMPFLFSGIAHAELACYDCHGERGTVDLRPVDSGSRDAATGYFRGDHRSHIQDRVPPAEKGRCATCHSGSEAYTSGHRDGKVTLSTNINESPATTDYVVRGVPGTFRNMTTQPAVGTCSNVNCHFETETPKWAEETLASQCSSCHTAPPSDGSHRRKHPLYFGEGLDSCSTCHPDHRSDVSPYGHATSAGSRGLKIGFGAYGGTYGGPGSSAAYPDYLPSQNPKRDGSCSGLYCHSDGRGGPPNQILTWSDKRSSQCYSCHKGRSSRASDAVPQQSDSTFANCTSTFGVWSSAKGYCTPGLTMDSNGHHRLVGAQWVRKYPCYYCHNATVDINGAIKDPAMHLVNKGVDVAFAPQWEIPNRSKPLFDRQAKSCDNIYCHSDGTKDPDNIRTVKWTDGRMECNSCHGHPKGACVICHDGKKKFLLNNMSSVLSVQSNWPAGQDWKASLPMFANQGPGTGRANSHPRHVETDFTCDHCHSDTILNGTCTDCHQAGVPSKSMTEEAHINPAFHVNKDRDVKFKNGGTWDPVRKTCSNTACHTGTGDVDPVWGGSVNSGVTCLSCHSTTAGDVDSFGYVIDGARAKINKTDWETTGHGRYSSAANGGSYSKSGNPAANFPGNPCWYCHDNNVLHNYSTNPFRLRMHSQYKKRFEKECVYCHMERTDAECIACHVGQPQSLSPQATIGGITIKYKFNNLSTMVLYPAHTDVDRCTQATCHDSDSGTFASGGHKGHDSNAGVWTFEQKKDIEKQYMMMGVCLQCHDDDTSNQCTSCHLPPPDNPNKYALGFNPGTGYIKPRKARASGSHFGYKHYRDFTKTGGWAKVDGKVQGVWKGGKFCWDCHDPHGDSNIYMIQREVATETDGTYGIPKKRALVTFIDNASGTAYAKKTGTIDGICNVCHSTDSKHFTSTGGDGHNLTRRCTSCHEHRFADSHAAKQSCDSCHSNEKPIPKHTSFGLPRDCTKCHAGTVGRRMDVMGQMKANSHHVQGIEVTNRHCYECHWESTPIGLIDVQYHTGYNYLSYTSVKNDPVDLVLYGKGERPTVYRNISTAAGRATVTTFVASNMGTAQERNEVSKVSNHCLSCHNDENNDTTPFGDCKTPRQYAWDLQSIKSRYSQTGTATWGKYPSTPNAAQKNIVKSFSAHGNGIANGGGFSATTGLDGVITNSRGGVDNKNVQCFDCHNSHGSKVVGTTTSYVTFNGTNNGGNLKETKKDMGGYLYDYKASANTSGVNPYGAGAGQCFDCHNTEFAGGVVPTGRTPWGYRSTFGVSAPVMGYKDTPRFGEGTKASTTRYPERMSRSIIGGHLKASTPNGAPANLARESGTASSGTTTTLTDSAKTWWVPDNSEVSTGGNLLTVRPTGTSLTTTYTYNKPSSSTYYSPPIGTGRSIAKIWVDYTPKNSTDRLTIINQVNQQIIQITGSTAQFHGWVDVVTGTATTGLRVTYYSPATGLAGTGGDVPKVLRNVQLPENKWNNLYVLMGSGNNAGQLRKISGYTANTLTFEPFNAPVAASDTYKIVPYSMTINGLCTPCHDPHGVSPALGANQAYALPLLKGTWMTSPYKEDAPPPNPYGSEATDKSWGQYTVTHKYGLKGTAPVTKHTLDRNTFGTQNGVSKFVTENDAKFGGLCLNCHKKETLTDGTNRNNAANGFKTLDRVHESVKGWGVNSEHGFTCSKCHQPHNSGLPRLMQTNCLDYNHRGGRASGGTAWSADKQYNYRPHNSGNEHRGYPIGSILGGPGSPESTTGCHVGRYSPAYNYSLPPSQWPDGNLWNAVTPW